jgi:hypothetical protein
MLDRSTPLFLTRCLMGLSLLGAACVCAQTTPGSSAAKGGDQRTGAVEPRVEHIHLEDKGSVIDELRVGGETKSIEVKPKGGMPAYQVAPESGQRSWKVLGF